jgi:hypothetical protein
LEYGETNEKSDQEREGEDGDAEWKETVLSTMFHGEEEMWRLA